MPNYNSPFLHRAILSVIEQTYEKWELILVDNFSNDSPGKIINQFNDNRIHFYKFNNENNIARARNFGIKKAKFDWIAFLDSDDVWKKNKIETVKKIIEQQNSDFVYHGMYYLPKKFGFIKVFIVSIIALAAVWIGESWGVSGFSGIHDNGPPAWNKVIIVPNILNAEPTIAILSFNVAGSAINATCQIVNGSDTTELIKNVPIYE